MLSVSTMEQDMFTIKHDISEIILLSPSTATGLRGQPRTELLNSRLSSFLSGVKMLLSQQATPWMIADVTKK